MEKCRLVDIFRWTVKSSDLQRQVAIHFWALDLDENDQSALLRMRILTQTSKSFKIVLSRLSRRDVLPEQHDLIRHAELSEGVFFHADPTLLS